MYNIENLREPGVKAISACISFLEANMELIKLMEFSNAELGFGNRRSGLL